MGKVVKGARVARDLYFLTVPEVELEEAQHVNGELDERFASPDGSLAFTGDETSFDDAPEFAEPVLVPKIDWEAVRAEAREIVDRAVEGGEAMLRDAASRAQALVAQAQAEAENIRAASRAAGHEEGVAAGRTEIEAQLTQTVSSLQSLVDEARAQRQIVIESAEPELVRLAMSIAERIVHEQITVDSNVVVENVRQALTRLVGREVVTLRVNPADLDTHSRAPRRPSPMRTTSNTSASSKTSASTAAALSSRPTPGPSTQKFRRRSAKRVARCSPSRR